MYKFLTSCVLVSAVLLGASMDAANIDQLLRAGEARANANATAQKRLVAMAEETDQAVADYKNALKVLDGLTIYNSLQKKQVANQQAEKVNLQESIGKIGNIERQIVPLMVNMVESLKKFVAADVPFLLGERNKRVKGLEDLLADPGVARAEKLRAVLEAYSIETDFGNTIERYKDKITLGGNEQEVNFLRIGRIALAYQSEDGSYTGAWDKEQGQFVELSPADYKSQVSFGLKVAGKEISPDLFIIPVQAAQGAN